MVSDAVSNMDRFTVTDLESSQGGSVLRPDTRASSQPEVAAVFPAGVWQA